MDRKNSTTSWPEDQEGGLCGMENLEGNALFLIFLFLLLWMLPKTTPSHGEGVRVVAAEQVPVIPR